MRRSLAGWFEVTVEFLAVVAMRTGLHGVGARMARMRATRLARTRSGEVIASGLHQYLGAFIAENDQLHAAIGRQFKFG